MKKKCKHKWVPMEDGSLDRICVKCRKFAMQNIMEPLIADVSASMSIPAGRETMEVPFYNGSEHTRMTVYKDDLMKQISKEIGAPGALLNSARR